LFRLNKRNKFYILCFIKIYIYIYIYIEREREREREGGKSYVFDDVNVNYSIFANKRYLDSYIELCTMRRLFHSSLDKSLL